MTNDEKAKAYEMALEAARKELGVDRKEWEVVEHVLHNIFPELRESEDERIRKRAIAILKQQRDFWSYDGPMDKFPPSSPRKDLVEAIDIALSYLEKLKEQKPEYPFTPDECIKPAEWSKEDEKMYTIMNSVIKSNIGDTSLLNYIDRENLFKLKNWLENRFKSLRPQPHWKPSEEQMYALAKALTLYGGGLASLYQDLKKLM